MRVKCTCGGKFRRSDIRAVRQNGQTYYQDTDNKVAHWICDGCSARRTQKKRQPRPRPGDHITGIAPLPGQILIIGTNYVTGPFNDSTDAELWIASHQVPRPWTMIRLGTAVTIGTPEVAHHCGTVVTQPDPLCNCPQGIHLANATNCLANLPSPPLEHNR